MMTQNVVTTKDVEFRPVLTVVTTEAPFQHKSGEVRFAKVDSKTIVIEFPKPVKVQSDVRQRNLQKLFGRIYDCGVVALVSSSAVAAVYCLLTLLQY
jgi:hypothetical protein